ncbi:MAG TPA: transketolase [Chromatiales bacterium]|nr:transketolase [Thiotrichales bacterium]HIP69128.1 transketolase [Chromatiales bacterium]
MPTRRDLANAIRALAMDAVQKANSGHPGAPMGMADIAEVLYNDFMKHNPGNPKWVDRDRFIMSNGHGSMLPYSVLHLTGYNLPMDELKNFRQLHSKTPGHPEYGYAPGIETTTGPLGQGITNGVGMAIAEKSLAAHFNRDGHEIVDHHTYVFLGDGCLMEGISHEACSLAGTLGLGKLIAFYDDNNISIDGEVEGWFTDDTPKRFEAYGWHVIPDVDGHDADAIKKAIEAARAETDKPSFICCKTTIGFGSPNKGGKEDCHGAPLGEDEIELTRKELGWSHGPFQIPEDIYEGWDAKDKGAKAEAAWDTKMAAYKKDHPELARGFERRMAGELVDGWEDKANAFIQAVAAKAESIPSRKASQNSIEALSGFTDFMGGSADLAGSNLTIVSNSVPMRADTPDANYLNYGVREFAMGAIVNGIALHGGFVPYGATFLMFSEYQRNALRMAALMQIQHIEVFTHDSIGLGEDGPTHQPVEQIATLRMIPRMSVWRPCDAVESAVAWKLAVKRKNAPTSLIFSRQNLDHQNRSAKQIESIEKGGYILKDPDGEPDAILIATGSEVGLAIKAAAELENSGKKIRVVSMPSADTFDAQDEVYKASVLPGNRTPRIAIEAGVSDYWRKYVGLNGEVVGIDTFGESAPAGQLFEHFGFTVENVVKTVEGLL